ncbi:hypothetical protein TNIN_326611 [Trichonephila inaurata madagascariensis]|uniref:RNase H type-1 domain-containing protein n=1 Tax=Trichonephila inaurata madagascariensis TaxID=2747483 RepID=A0A8X7BUY0_9ARAC|nr:hypothetical protein TNIN_326611 [Trichonephila inaurata madagascariensis]
MKVFSRSFDNRSHVFSPPEIEFSDLQILPATIYQHPNNWFLVGYKTSISILHKLRLVSQFPDIHMQWIFSNADIHGNELVDKVAERGCNGLAPSSVLELSYLRKEKCLSSALSFE